MKRIDWRIVVGGLLVLGGALGLFQQAGLLKNASDAFWGAIFSLAGLAFLYLFVTNRGNWWSAFPAFGLIGLGVLIFLPASLEGWGGAVFLGAFGLGFFAVYLTSRERWWAIIPGGVLATLAAVSVVDEVFKQGDDSSGGLFFIGLGLTFLLVAILPAPARMTWAYIPAVVLIVMGALIGTPFLGAFSDYLWPALLIVGGILLIFFYFRRDRA